MTREHAGKARWARGKAEDLHGQARELEQDRTGDCQAMVRRRGGGFGSKLFTSRHSSVGYGFF